jgi:hypothetical protein
LFSIDGASTALNIIWLLMIWETNFKERRYFEENEMIQMISQNREKSETVIPNARQHVGDLPEGSFATRN